MKTITGYITNKHYKHKGTYKGIRHSYSVQEQRITSTDHVFGTGQLDTNGAQILYKESV